MPSLLIPDRWRSTVRAPIRAADRAARLISVRPQMGTPYTVSGAVVARWARIFEARLIHAERVIRGGWLP